MDNTTLQTEAHQNPLPPSKQSGLLKPRRLRLAGIVLLLSGLIAGSGYFLKAESRSNAQSDAYVLPVKTMRVEAVQSYPETRTYMGDVTATRTSELGFERSGKLEWLIVDQGDEVDAGAPIAKLDTQNLEAQFQQLMAKREEAMARLQELKNGPRIESIEVARARVDDVLSQLNLERLRQSRREYLYQEGAISREQLDEVSSIQDALTERLLAAQSQLRELETGTRPEQIASQQAVVKQLDASIADLEITIAKSTLYAPYAGIIAQRYLDEGTVVESGQPIVRFVDKASPEVEVGVPVDVISQLRIGSPYPIEIGGETYHAVLISILPEVSATTRTRTAVLALSTSDFSRIAPNQVARLEITQMISADGFWLPISALVQGDRGLWYCYLLVETEMTSGSNLAYQVKQQNVEVIYTDGDRVLVRGTLEPGHQIITSGTQRIVPGQLVHPID